MPVVGFRAGIRRTGTRSRKTRAKQVMTDYFLSAESIDFNVFASGADLNDTLFDNSVDAGNVPVRIVKLKAQIWWDMNVSSERALLMAVYRETQDATPLQLDVEADVKNATQNGQFFRRPVVTHTNIANYGLGMGHMDHFFKTLILKNILLDDDDDLVIGFTNQDSAFGASTQILRLRIEGWFKRL